MVTVPSGRPNASPAVRLEVLRVRSGHSAIVRFLSERYVGFKTHWKKPRSQCCYGDACPPDRHKCDVTWKGYCAGEEWKPALELWVPYVLEISENLELDFRGVFGRGQTWEIWKERTVKGESEPVQGKLLESLDPATLPKEFDFLPVVCALYHVNILPAFCANPQAPRVFLEPSKGAPPAIFAVPGAGQGEGVASFSKAFEERQRLAAESKEGPTETKKRRGY